jgi:hypothetical protein
MMYLCKHYITGLIIGSIESIGITKGLRVDFGTGTYIVDQVNDNELIVKPVWRIFWN